MTILEQSEALDGGIIQTIRRRDGSECLVRIDELAAFAIAMIDEESHELKMGWELQAEWYADQFNQLRGAVNRAIADAEIEP